MNGSKADVEKIKRLEEALSQSHSDLQMALGKIHKFEKLEAKSDQFSRLQEFHGAFSDFGDNKYYVEHLEQQIQDSKNTIVNLKKEIQTTILLQLGERDQLRETERLLYACEIKAEKLQAENIKLRLKLDGLRMKLQNQENDGCTKTNTLNSSSTNTNTVTIRRQKTTRDGSKNAVKSSEHSNKTNGCEESKYTLRWEKLQSYKKSKLQPKNQTEKEENLMDGDDLQIDNASFPNETTRSRKPSKVRFNIDDENVDVTDLDQKHLEEVNSDQNERNAMSSKETVSMLNTDPPSDVSAPTMSKNLQSKRNETVRVFIKKDGVKRNECAQQ